MQDIAPIPSKSNYYSYLRNYVVDTISVLPHNRSATPKQGVHRTYPHTRSLIILTGITDPLITPDTFDFRFCDA